MSSQRFRNLELGNKAPPPPDDDAPTRSRRALELGDEIPLDTSGVIRTDFCRRCRAECPEGAAECHACGGPLGGAGQEDFDQEIRAERARLRAERARADTEARLPGPLRGSEPPPDLRHGAGSALEPPPGIPDIDPPPSSRDEPGFGAVIATGALLAVSFALVSIPVRLVIAAWAGQPVPSRAFGEILLCAGLTLALWWRYGRALMQL